MRATRLASILLHLTSLRNNAEYHLWSYSLCNFLNYSVTTTFVCLYVLSNVYRAAMWTSEVRNTGVSYILPEGGARNQSPASPAQNTTLATVQCPPLLWY